MVNGSLLRIIVLILAAVSELYNYSSFTLLFIILSIIIYQMTQGSVGWVYSSEVAQDQAFGICVLAQQAGILFNSLTAEFLFDSCL